MIRAATLDAKNILYPAGRYDAASASANNKGYIIGGDDGSNYLSSAGITRYQTPGTGFQSLRLQTSGPSAFGIGSKLFAAAGYAGFMAASTTICLNTPEAIIFCVVKQPHFQPLDIFQQRQLFSNNHQVSQPAGSNHCCTNRYLLCQA